MSDEPWPCFRCPSCGKRTLPPVPVWRCPDRDCGDSLTGAADDPVLRTKPSHFNWDALTAKQIAAVIESAPVVLGEWYGDDESRRVARRREDIVHCVYQAASGKWLWESDEHFAERPYVAPTRKAAMEAADAAARERGWRLMGGE